MSCATAILASLARGAQRAEISPKRPLRAHLSDAIEAHKVTVLEHADALGAIERARKHVAATHAALDQAKEKVDEAKRAQEQELVDAAKSGEAIKTDSTLREARAAQLEAEDQYSEARSAASQ